MGGLETRDDDDEDEEDEEEAEERFDLADFS